jgi:hypothetical protein
VEEQEAGHEGRRGQAVLKGSIHFHKGKSSKAYNGHRNATHFLSLQSVYSIPTCGGVFLAYTVPGYILAGIHYNEVVARDFDVFYLYLGK